MTKNSIVLANTEAINNLYNMRLKLATCVRKYSVELFFKLLLTLLDVFILVSVVRVE